MARSVQISEEVYGAERRAPHLPLTSLEIATLKVRHCAAAVHKKDFLEFTVDKSLTIDLKDLFCECFCSVSSHQSNLQNAAGIGVSKICSSSEDVPTLGECEFG